MDHYTSRAQSGSDPIWLDFYSPGITHSAEAGVRRQENSIRPGSILYIDCSESKTGKISFKNLQAWQIVPGCLKPEYFPPQLEASQRGYSS
jgi:hypothetical protein